MNSDSEHKRALWICLALVLGTLALYWPVTHHQFLDYDDDQYVTDNPQVLHGLSAAGVKWAFTTSYAANWHPLTWISHMLDVSINGNFAGGHLLTNVALHSVNAVLLFLLLMRMTNAIWPSALVAALFAWHPLHVESVAWVAERKDVLSTFFLLLTLMAYARYVEQRNAGSRRRKEAVPANEPKPGHPPPHVGSYESGMGLYALSLVLFALGLMCKPMLVTLPFVLLLLDYWPLARWQRADPTRLSTIPYQLSTLWSLALEKLPFFALSAAACVVTTLVQHAGGAIKSFSHIPVLVRVFNAPTAYVRYMGITIWPAKLSVMYPLPAQPQVLLGMISLAVLLAVSIVVLLRRAQWPWLVTGWLWFLGTLVPVIGIVQVGEQALADRYTYVPIIGLFIGAAWSLEQWLATRPLTRNTAYGIAGLLVLACALLTQRELSYWQDSITLFSRAVAVTKDNWIAYNNLGVGLSKEGRRMEAIDAFQSAVLINPDYPQAQYNLGIDLAGAGEYARAQEHFSQVLRMNPDSEDARNNLGVVLAQQGSLTAAVEQFRQAIALKPDMTNAYVNLGMALQQLGQTGAAITNYSRALTLDGDSPQALDKLAVLYATCPEPEWRNLKAAAVLEERANDLTGHQQPGYMDSLAAIYAAAGDFPKAVSTAEQALQLAQSAGLDALAAQIGTKLTAYRAGKTAVVQGASGFGVQK